MKFYIVKKVWYELGQDSSKMTSTRMVKLYNLYPSTREKKEAYAKLIIFHPWRRQVEFGRVIKFWADDEYLNGQTIRFVSNIQEKDSHAPN